MCWHLNCNGHCHHTQRPLILSRAGLSAHESACGLPYKSRALLISLCHDPEIMIAVQSYITDIIKQQWFIVAAYYSSHGSKANSSWAQSCPRSVMVIFCYVPAIQNQTRWELCRCTIHNYKNVKFPLPMFITDNERTSWSHQTGSVSALFTKLKSAIALCVNITQRHHLIRPLIVCFPKSCPYMECQMKYFRFE